MKSGVPWLPSQLVAQTVAWSIGSDYLPQHIETARWLMKRRAVG